MLRSQHCFGVLLHLDKTHFHSLFGFQHFPSSWKEREMKTPSNVRKELCAHVGADPGGKFCKSYQNPVKVRLGLMARLG